MRKIQQSNERLLKKQLAKRRKRRREAIIQLDNIKISFIIPTRGRPEKLKNCLRSIYRTANKPERIAVFIRIDDDDIESIELFRKDKEIRKYANIRLFSGPRVGWKNTHNVFRYFFGFVKTDIIVPFCDDREVTLNGWDNIFLSHANKPLIFGTNINFAFTREAIEKYEWLRNWMNRTPKVDGLIWKKARKKGIYKPCPEWIKKRESGDLTKRQRQNEFEYVPSVEVKDWKNKL